MGAKNDSPTPRNDLDFPPDIKTEENFDAQAGETNQGISHARGGRTKDFHPGGHKGKLHRELHIPEGQKIGADRIAKATHSSNPEIRRDAIRARTMSHWKKG